MVNSKATANRPKPRFSKAVLLLFFQPIKHITKEVIKVIGPKIWKIICVFKSPEIINKTPNANKAPLIFISSFFDISSSVTFINLEVNIELITRAINKEEKSTVESVNGKYIINLPIIPGQKPRGKKAAKVVAVEAIIGHAISPTPRFA